MINGFGRLRRTVPGHQESVDWLNPTTFRRRLMDAKRPFAQRTRVFAAGGRSLDDTLRPCRVSDHYIAPKRAGSANQNRLPIRRKS